MFSHGFTVPVAAFLLVLTVPLAARRRYPFSVAAVVVAGFISSPGSSCMFLRRTSRCSPAWLMIYSVAVHGQRRYRTAVLSVCYGVIVVEGVRELFFVAPITGGPPLARSFSLLYNVVVLALPWLLRTAPLVVGGDRQRISPAKRIELQAEREENARQAILAERSSIARELHDVVAHHVSIIGVQARGGSPGHGAATGPPAEALTSIERADRHAVVELHRLLGFLKRTGEIDELAPQPGLAQLGKLIAEEGQAELTVNLTVEGEAKALSPTLDVSAYRVIQEALTNTRKHSKAACATVRIQYGTWGLDVEVLDDFEPNQEAELR